MIIRNILGYGIRLIKAVYLIIMVNIGLGTRDLRSDKIYLYVIFLHKNGLNISAKYDYDIHKYILDNFGDVISHLLLLVF